MSFIIRFSIFQGVLFRKSTTPVILDVFEGGTCWSYSNFIILSTNTLVTRKSWGQVQNYLRLTRFDDAKSLTYHLFLIIIEYHNRPAILLTRGSPEDRGSIDSHACDDANNATPTATNYEGAINNGNIKGLSDLSRPPTSGATSDTWSDDAVMSAAKCTGWVCASKEGRDEEVGRREAIKLTETLATPSSLPPVYCHPRASPADLTTTPSNMPSLTREALRPLLRNAGVINIFRNPRKIVSLSCAAAELPRRRSNFAGVSPTATVKGWSDR